MSSFLREMEAEFGRQNDELAKAQRRQADRADAARLIGQTPSLITMLIAVLVLLG